MTPVIKVIGNSFLILGLFLALLSPFFWNFWTFLNSWDNFTADSYLVFKKQPTHSREIGKKVGFFNVKMSNQVFQRAIFNFFQFPWRFSPGLQFFYNFLSKMDKLYLNDQKLSKSSFDDLIWHQNYQTHFNFSPFHLNCLVRARLF